MEKAKKDLLVFGYGLSLLMTIFGVRWLIKGIWLPLADAFLLTAIVMFCLTLLNVEIIRPFYRRWMKVAHAIGGVVTTIIFSVLFYAVFSAVGIVLRLMKKDLLDETLNREAGSYWSKKTLETFQKKRYTQQF